MTEDLLRIDGLHVGFRTGDRTRHVVRGVDLRISRERSWGLWENPAPAKASPALAVMRLLPPGAAITSGRVTFRGRNLNRGQHS